MASTTRILQFNALRRASTRSYHSHNYPSPPGPFGPTETAILSAALQHVPSHGFTHTALTLGAKDAGYLDVSTNLFPQGVFTLVHYHLVTQRLALSQHSRHIKEARNNDGKHLGLAARAKALTWERLRSNKEIVHRWQEALAIMALARNVSISMHELASLCDEVWFLAGDASVDTSWYTKRASLSVIYAATELFMTADKSEDFNETQEFLNRRFDDSAALGSTARSLGQWADFTVAASISVLRSKGVRI